jgi:hypothetical protein
LIHQNLLNDPSEIDPSTHHDDRPNSSFLFNQNLYWVDVSPQEGKNSNKATKQLDSAELASSHSAQIEQLKHKIQELKQLNQNYLTKI